MPANLLSVATYVDETAQQVTLTGSCPHGVLHAALAYADYQNARFDVLEEIRQDLIRSHQAKYTCACPVDPSRAVYASC